MPERNIKLLIEYDGTAYSGWQVQPNAPTVQGELQTALARVVGQEHEITGAGRTDAGVHALGQVAHVRIEHAIEPCRLAPALNYYLPDDIFVKQSTEAGEDFHARFSAVWRRYRYIISSDRSALYRHLRWETEDQLDYRKLQQAAALIIGVHDFAPFCVVMSRKEDCRCEIYHSRWYRWGNSLIYEIRGNRFLHSMVRSLVGGMVNLAQAEPDNNMQNLTLARFADIIASPADERVPFMAPAHGLYLVKVGYPEEA